MAITYVKKTSIPNCSSKPVTIYAEKLKVIATKSQEVLDLLLAGERLTVRYAAHELDIYCLAGLIFHLRHHKNIPVQTQLIKKLKNGLIKGQKPATQASTPKNSDAVLDSCFLAGKSAAEVYIANFVQLAKENILASEVMEQACTKKGQTAPDPSSCSRTCEMGFKAAARKALK